MGLESAKLRCPLQPLGRAYSTLPANPPQLPTQARFDSTVPLRTPERL